jgi:hypothetical protein
MCREVEELRSELEATGRGGMARGRSLLPNIGLSTPPNKKNQSAKKRVTIAVERYKVILIGLSNQCCGSGSGSAWIRNFLSDPDPELEVSDPDPGQSPKLDGKMHKNHQKMN